VIYKNTVVDGVLGNDVAYELRATLKIGATGGTFVLYSHASTDALTGPATQGSYYAGEFTPTVSGGGCSMAATFYKRFSGSVWTIGVQTLACKDGMTIRWTQRNGYFSVITSLNELVVISDNSVPSGRPGFGSRGLHSSNGMSEVRLGNLEYTAPGAITSSSLRTAAFDNRIDLEWPGVADDANGSGMLMYQVHRNGNFLGRARGGFFTDATVTAGQNYTYTIYPHDVHLNFSSTAVTVATPATGYKDPRKLGLRSLGTYWGASPENIDLQSGNLSFSLPTVTAQGRGGTAVPIHLSYNSQNWRKDGSGTWLLGTDVGFGFGWKLLAGSLTPVYSDWFTVNHYLYTDSTGAEYVLGTVTGGGKWRSKESIYIEYDPATRRLYFPSGVYWEFDCLTVGTESEIGTLYPTRLVDTNGNEIRMKYQGGLYYGGDNGSARLTTVEDVRAVNVSGTYKTYSLTYNNDAIPHLTGITSHLPSDSSNFSFTYSGASALTEPFTNTGSFGTAVDLATMTVPGGSGLNFTMEYHAGSHELKKVTLPYLGTIAWEYGSKTLAGSRTTREVTSRVTNANDGEGNKTYTISHDDAGDLSRPAHYYTVVSDASGAADKVYYFSTTTDYTLGLFTTLNERAMPSMTSKRITQVNWTQTATTANPYIWRTDETMDIYQTGIEKASRTEQTIDQWGNMTERKQYGHYTPGGTPALAATYTYTYVTDDSNYTTRHIWNRIRTASVQRPSESAISLVINGYDNYSIPPMSAVSNPSLLRQHDTANYGTLFYYRGNVTNRTSPGSMVTMTYDYTGTNLSMSDAYGHGRTQTPSSTQNYAVPSATTTGSLGASFTWNGANQATSSTGPNGAASYASYDGYLRPSSKTAPNGSVTTLTYGSNWTQATTGTRWTKSWVDGFGRTKKVESGYISGGSPVTVSTVETKYAPCACSPLGKLWKTSLPYGPGGTVRWTEHLYDALGRTVEVKQPSSSGSTTYIYAGNRVETRDPKNKWKKYENDAFGNLVKVIEPRPGGGADYETTYTYSALGKLLTTTMTRPHPSTGTNYTQTRTWVYNSWQQLTSVTHPESGTTSYTYNLDGSVQEKTDAKGQRIAYAYDGDGRVTSTRRYGNSTPGSEAPCARVDYYYGGQSFDPSFTQNAAGRLAATATGTATGCSASGVGSVIEMYSYNVAGAVTKKRLRIVRPAGTVDKDIAYSYGSDGKLTGVLYPDATIAYQYTYDLMDRPTKMTGPRWNTSTVSIDYVKDVVYGVAGQVTSMKYLQWLEENPTSVYTPYYYTETKAYNDLFQLTRQTTNTWSGPAAADIEYGYSATQNNGRIETRKNYLRNGVTGETVTYQYDELNRLTSAASNVGWTQTFGMDGFGNLLTQTMTGGSATPMSVSIDMNKNRINTAGWAYDSNGNTVDMPTTGGTATMTHDIDNRVSSWTGPSSNVEQYSYLADNKRVWKKAPGGAETVYFYGVGGQKIATYTVQASPFAFTGMQDNVYFGGKLIRANGVSVVHDRLGSVVARDSGGTVTKIDYLPYGEEMGGATSGNVDKYGTYHRDQTTGLDYADQRYYSGAIGGRFLTADPIGSGMNHYAYVGGDPANFADPTGLIRYLPGATNACGDLIIDGGIYSGRSVYDVMNGRSDNDLLAQLVWHEDGTIYGVDIENPGGYRQDMAAIVTSVLNQVDVDNHRIYVHTGTAAACPLGSCSNRSLFEILTQTNFASYYNQGGVLVRVFDSAGAMIRGDRDRLDSVLDTDYQSQPTVQDSSGLYVNRACEGLLQSLTVTSNIVDGSWARVSPDGLTLLFWDHTASATHPNLPGYKKWRSGRTAPRGHSFWGLQSGLPPPPPPPRGKDTLPRQGPRI